MYAFIVDDLVRVDFSRSQAREHVNQILSGTQEVEQQRQGETRAEKYQRLAAQDGDTLPERID